MSIWDWLKRLRGQGNAEISQAADLSVRPYQETVGA
jgi:hypothetical protein